MKVPIILQLRKYVYFFFKMTGKFEIFYIFQTRNSTFHCGGQVKREYSLIFKQIYLNKRSRFFSVKNTLRVYRVFSCNDLNRWLTLFATEQISKTVSNKK